MKIEIKHNVDNFREAEDHNKITIRMDWHGYGDEEMIQLPGFDDATAEVDDEAVKWLNKEIDQFNKDKGWTDLKLVTPTLTQKLHIFDDFVSKDVSVNLETSCYYGSQAEIELTNLTEEQKGYTLLEAYAKALKEHLEQSNILGDFNDMMSDTLCEYQLEFPNREHHCNDDINTIFDKIEAAGYVYDYDPYGELVPIDKATPQQINRHKNRVLSKDEDCAVKQFIWDGVKQKEEA
jgi:hypothetical protein